MLREIVMAAFRSVAPEMKAEGIEDDTRTEAGSGSQGGMLPYSEPSADPCLYPPYLFNFN